MKVNCSCKAVYVTAVSVQLGIYSVASRSCRVYRVCIKRSQVLVVIDKLVHQIREMFACKMVRTGCVSHWD
jgi:hypothetical protein